MRILLSVLMISLTVGLYAQQDLLDAYNLKNSYLQQGDALKTDSLCQVIAELLPKYFTNTDAGYAGYANDLGSSFANIKNPNKALYWYSASYNAYKSLYGDSHEYTAVTLYNIANTQYSLNQSELAKKAYLKSYEALNTVNGPSHAYTVMALESLIAFMAERGEFEELIPYQTAYTVHQENASGPRSINYAVELNYLASMQETVQNKQEALNNYLKAYEIIAELEGEKENQAYVARNLGLLYKTLGNYTAAEQYLLTFYRYLESTGERNIEYGASLSHLGDLYTTMSRYQAADTFHLKAYEHISSLMPGTEDHLNSLNNLGYNYKEMGSYEKAEKYLIQALELGKELSVVPAYQTVLNNLGLVYMELGEYEKAESHFLEAITKKEYVGEGDHSFVLNNIGLLYFYMGQFDKADDYFRASLEIKNRVYGPNHTNYATTLLNIANVHTSLGRYQDAIELYKQSLKIYDGQLGRESRYSAIALTNMAEMYIGLGNYEYGIDRYFEALQIQERLLGREHPLYLSNLNGIAIFCRYTGQFDTAEKLFRESALTRYKVLGPSHPDYLISLMNLTELYDVQNELESTDSLMTLLNDYYTENGTGDYLEANFLNHYGSLLMKQGNCKESVNAYEKAASLREEIYGSDHQLYAEALNNLATAYVCVNDNSAAYEVYRKSNEILIQQVRNTYPYLSEKDKAQFFRTISFQFEGFVSYAVNWAETRPEVWADLFEYQLIFKGLLLDETSGIRNRVESSDDLGLVQVFEEWKSQKEYLAHIYSMDLNALNKRNIDIRSEENKANELEKQMIDESNQLESLIEQDKVTYTEVKAHLKDNEAVVDIVRAEVFDRGKWQDSVLYVALITTSSTGSHPEAVVMENGKFLETGALKAYRNQVKFQIEDLHSYGIYWEKIQSKLDSIGDYNKIYISRDGVYNNINLLGLLKPSSNNYLIDDFEMILLSNSRNLVREKFSTLKDLKERSVLLFGNPDFDHPFEFEIEQLDSSVFEAKSRAFTFEKVLSLPGTKVEVEQIRGLLENSDVKVQLFQEENATENAIKSIRNPYILHIATHGFFLPSSDVKDQRMESNPLLKSGLLLAGSNQTTSNLTRPVKGTEDGILTAYEATNMSLQDTELVVLSACETGLGEIVNGEGVYGLQRAFGIAGAEAVLMSLWKVDDQATNEMMTAFYRSLLAGSDKRSALRAAQLQLKEKYPLPYYWASFVLVEM